MKFLSKFYLLVVLVVLNVDAFNIEGSYKATKSCEAFQSFKKKTNPGNIKTIAGTTYKVIAQNKKDASWVRIVIPNIDKNQRWVSEECGELKKTSVDNLSSGSHQSSRNNKCNIANTYDSNVLAISWQATFCEHVRRDKPECKALNSGEITITNLTIHGLWPSKNGCRKNYGKCTSTPLDLEESTVKTIAQWMPNFYYGNKFGQHEWSKHGTCQSLSDDDYFLLTKTLVEKFDKSPLGIYMRSNLGKTIKTSDMKKFLIDEIGKEVVDRIQLICKKNYLNEFWINLPKEINHLGSLNELVGDAKKRKSFKGNCREYIHIEAPGL